MNWLLDLGNTRLKLARLEAGGLAGLQAWTHGEAEFAPAFDAWCQGRGEDDCAWLASVADAATTASVRSLLVRHGLRVEAVAVQPECAGVRIAYAEPARLGVDRFLALLGAHQRGPGPWLLVSLGSAVTADLLDAGGRHRGGWIAASPSHQRAALAARFPALDVAGGEVRAFAADTGDALASGAGAALVGAIELSHRRAEKELGKAPQLLLSGGDAATWAPHLSLPVQLAPTLVLEGLALFATRRGAP